MELKQVKHGVYKIGYHMVLCVKYRKQLLRGEVREGIGEILAEISERFEIWYDEVGFEEDHVHILCGAHQEKSPSWVIMITKSKTGRQIFKKFPELRKELWGGKFWSAGKYIGAVANKVKR